MITSPARLVPTRLFSSVAAACVFAAATVIATAPANTNTLIAASILKDIRNEIRDYSKLQAATLLIVVSIEDDRPVYIDHALLVLQFPKGQWMLVQAQRPAKPSPVRASWNPKWQPFTVTDSPLRFNRPFDHPPTREEVNLFLKDNQFQLESDQSDRVVERVIDEDAWERVLGFKSEIKPHQRAVPDSLADKNVGGTGDLSEEAASSRILGRWELPGGEESMEFSKDRKCLVHFGDGMIAGTYSISSNGRITVDAKTEGVTLSLRFHFEGERLTDGVVFFESGKRFWQKATQ